MNEALYILFDRKCHDIVDIINAQHKISDMLRPCGMNEICWGIFSICSTR